MTLAGFPHSGISGSTPACGSPKLIAADHALLRLLVPRHPPCALSSLTIRTISGLRVEDSARLTTGSLRLQSRSLAVAVPFVSYQDACAIRTVAAPPLEGAALLESPSTSIHLSKSRPFGLSRLTSRRREEGLDVAGPRPSEVYPERR